MRNSPCTFLLFAFLIIICSSVLPAFSLQNNISISSHGTVDYSGLPPPSPNTWNLDITVTPANSGITSLQGTQTIPVGQNISMHATPNSGYTFKYWLFDGNSLTSNPIAIPSQSAGSTHTLDATFTLIVQPEDVYAGFRCNGERTPDYWISVADRYSALVPNADPGGIWIIASSKVLTFDAVTNAHLSALDDSGVKVYLQPGEEGGWWPPGSQGVFNPYPASIDELLTKVLENYGHHSCVIGVGFDLEQRGQVWNDFEASKVTDEEAARWENQVKAYNPKFKLFLKHWMTYVMPPSYRGDIVFVYMGGWLGSALLNEYRTWGNYYSGNKVSFQVGYGNAPDRDWWIQMSNPPQEMASWIFLNVPNTEGVYWVNCDGSVFEVFP